MPTLDLRQVPKNAGCGWSQTPGFWRGAADVCPVNLAIQADPYFDGEHVCAVNMSIEGGWLSGQVGYTCSSNSYVQSSNANRGLLRVNIWKALADGLWSSSVAFTIRLGRYTTYSSGVTMSARADGLALPAPVSMAPITAAYISPVSACPTVAVATLTVYDNGTLALA